MLTEYTLSQVSRSGAFQRQTSIRSFCEKHRSNSCCTYYGHLTIAFKNYALLGFHLNPASQLPLSVEEEEGNGEAQATEARILLTRSAPNTHQLHTTPSEATIKGWNCKEPGIRRLIKSQPAW